MATTAFHIYSDYKAEDRERLEAESGQIEEAESDADVDREELLRTFGLSRRVLNPPRFVPATFTSEYWEPTNTTATSSNSSADAENGASIGGWYAALTRNTPTGTPRTASPAPGQPVKELSTIAKGKGVKRTKNDWFIARALEVSKAAEREAQASDHPSTSETATSSAPTLADILARDPPPLPSQEPFTPPIWLAIGPGNRGFDMLERSGWQEGQALGRASRDRQGLGYHVGKDKASARLDDAIGHLEEVKKEVIDLSLIDGEIVDLTISEDELEPDDVAAAASVELTMQSISASQESQSTDLDHAPRALLVPLPTVLKSDRLGIGLKAKTVGTGIYREPVRRVTHGQAALSAHIRANDKRQQMKKLVGRGRRGFERLKKHESSRRDDLLAYLNAD